VGSRACCMRSTVLDGAASGPGTSRPTSGDQDVVFGLRPFRGANQSVMLGP